MITSTVTRKTYTPSSTGATYATTFKVIESTHLVVQVIRQSDGNTVTLVKDTDYTVTSTGSDSGEDVDLSLYETANSITSWSTYDSGPWTLLLTLNIPVTQATDYVTNGRLSEQNIEDSLDKLTQIQQLNAQGLSGGSGSATSLNIQWPDDESSSTSNKMPRNAARLGKLCGFNSSTGELEAVDLNTTGAGLQGPSTQVDGRLAIYSSTTDLLKDNSDIAESLFTAQTLVYGGVVTWDSDSGHIATLNLSGDPTLDVTNIKTGTYKLIVVQDVTGGRTITFRTGFANADKVSLNTDASGVSVLSFTSDGTSVYYEGSSSSAKSVAGDVGTTKLFAYDFTDGNGFGASVSTEEDEAGYIVENGKAISRTKYADLFDKIGVTYGVGDGSTTFNVPDSITGGRFFRASSTAGTNQDDATAVNGLSDTGHDHEYTDHDNGTQTIISYQTGATQQSVDLLPGNLTTQSASANLIGDSETRPINQSRIPAIKF